MADTEKEKEKSSTPATSETCTVMVDRCGCTYAVDPCGCYVDPCGCGYYADPCCC
jgi:hypothetical protein